MVFVIIKIDELNKTIEEGVYRGVEMGSKLS